MTARIHFLVGIMCFASLAVPAYCAEGPLSFRGVQLGESVAEVKRKAAGEFFKVGEPTLYEPTLLDAGDAEGMAGLECPVHAEQARPRNCLRANFYFERVSGKQGLAVIKVDQSFYPPVPSEALVEKLRAVYGVERRRYEKSDITPNQYGGEEDIAMVWGGKTAPAIPFRPQSSLIYVDSAKIAGKYVTAVIHSASGKASGYRLRIVDADVLEARGREIRVLNASEAKKPEVESIGSVRF
jgi:hypothetical protein